MNLLVQRCPSYSSSTKARQYSSERGGSLLISPIIRKASELDWDNSAISPGDILSPMPVTPLFSGIGICQSGGKRGKKINSKMKNGTAYRINLPTCLASCCNAARWVVCSCSNSLV